MVTKIHKNSATQAESPPLTDAVKDSAQQIWQAGLGAFTRAQAEGSKAFEALVQEGVSIQRKTQAVAEERMADATQKMASMASEISNKASGQWGKLEHIFEDRVAKALSNLGMPSAKEINALIAHIDELNKTVQELKGKPARKTPAKVAPKPASKATAKPKAKAPAKRP
ncbi:poly granule associated protein [Rhodoferax lacus]|uniref:Poly granule associated protein n=1 Tax=Rhodoferax lacus TaxID=2184758 RepID=A0A3E1R998_9BURK|nr:phasin family protein [Rhodoferax lacus]RFO95948.1 poly granule associated protein [Rhodoferax lacus]